MNDVIDVKEKGRLVWRRFFAFLLDQLILVISAIPIVVLGIMTENAFFTSTIFIVVYIFLVELLQLKLFSGRTIGKKALKIKIVCSGTDEIPSTGILIARALLVRPAIALCSAFSSGLSIAYTILMFPGFTKGYPGNSIWNRITNTEVVRA